MSRTLTVRRLGLAAITLALALCLALPALAGTAGPGGDAAGAGTPGADAASARWPAWNTTPSVWTLRYQVLHVEDENGVDQLVLVVTNPTPNRVILSFPTAQKVDFALGRDGAEWWRTSRDQTFAQVVTREVLGPYQSRLYTAAIPGWLPTGPYQVTAYFLANGNRYPVAWTQIWLDGDEADASVLRFTLSYRSFGWQEGARLGLSISNPSPRPVLLTYPEGWAVRVEVHDATHQLVWERTIPAPARQETFRAGSSRYHFFPLPDLAPGRYTAQAWFAPAGDQPVASISFTAR